MTTCLAREVFRNSGASVCALATRLRFPLRFRFRGCRINREDPPGEPFDGGEVGQLNLAANKVCCRRQDLPREAEHGHGTVALQQRTRHQYYHERCRANAPRTHARHAGMLAWAGTGPSRRSAYHLWRSTARLDRSFPVQGHVYTCGSRCWRASMIRGPEDIGPASSRLSAFDQAKGCGTIIV